METFGRFASILITAVLLFMIPLFWRFSFEMSRNMDNVENTLNGLLERIRTRREITAAELVGISELSKTCGTKIMITVGIDRDIIVPEESFFYGYREYMYTDDVEKIVSEEGKLILLTGDTISLSIPMKKSRLLLNRFITNSRRSGLITAGGVI